MPLASNSSRQQLSSSRECILHSATYLLWQVALATSICQEALEKAKALFDGRLANVDQRPWTVQIFALLPGFRNEAFEGDLFIKACACACLPSSALWPSSM